jgi:hypothetical protein
VQGDGGQGGAHVVQKSTQYRMLDRPRFGFPGFHAVVAAFLTGLPES